MGETPREMFLLREVDSFALPDADGVRAVFLLNFEQFRCDFVHRLFERDFAEISRAVALERLVQPVRPVEPRLRRAAFYADSPFIADMVGVAFYFDDFVVLYMRYDSAKRPAHAACSRKTFSI